MAVLSSTEARKERGYHGSEKEVLESVIEEERFTVCASALLPSLPRESLKKSKWERVKERIPPVLS